MTDDRNLTGIACMVAGVALLTTMDGLAKLLVGAEYSALQILAVRGWFIVAALLAWLPRAGGAAALSTRHPLAHALRVAIGILAPYLFFTALGELPLADATAIFFGSTFMMTALSVPVFREQVGIHRWSAVIVGFIGVLIVTRPGIGAGGQGLGGFLQAGALLAIGASISYALLMVSSRWLGRTEPIYRLVFFYNAGLALVATLFLPVVWKPMAPMDVGVIFAMAVLGLAGHTLVIKAFVVAPIGVVAPFDYSSLIWAVAIGYLVWGDVPRDHVLLGSAVIILSGLYVIHREARQRRRRPPEPKP